MKFIFPLKEELEIKGIFDSNVQDIDFSKVDEKHVIITGKNGSGKTQLISMIKQQLNEKNKQKQLNEKKFIGHLTYNLAFNFDENRMGNVKEINDHGKILDFFEKIIKNDLNDFTLHTLQEYYKDELLNSIGKQPFEVFKPFNYFIYFNKVFNYLKDKYNINGKSPIDELNEDLKEFGILELKLKIKFEEAEGNLKINLDRNPTSGEVLFLNLLVLKWIHNNVKNFDFLLFDEPDRHFEPKVTEKFLKFLKSQFNEVFIFMTTHRPDSIVLSQSDFILCRLKKKEPNDHYLEKIAGKANEACNWFFVMSTIFDLTYNLRDIMNIKIRVYVESNDDYVFYNALYHLLLDYCNDLRNLPNEKKYCIQKKQHFFKEFPILSRRYQLYFCTSALNSKGGSGGFGMAEKHYNRDLTQQQLDINNFKNLWDGDFFSSYVILDRDGDLFSNNSHKYGNYNNFNVLKRYNFENYIVDPMFLFSMISKKSEIKENENENVIFFSKEYDVFDKDSDNIITSDENIKKYFRLLIKKLLQSKNLKIHEKVRGYIEKQKLVIEKMIIILNNDSINRLEEKKTFLNDYIDNLTINEELIDYLMIDARPEKYFKFLFSNNGKLVDPYFDTKEIKYPSILLDLNGKDCLVGIVNTMMNDKNIKNLIKSISNNKDRLWISKDLVEIFSNINSHIRGYPIYYLVEKETKQTKTITRDDALKIVKEAGFSDEKFNYNLNIYKDLKEWSVENNNIILNSSK